VKGGGVVKGLAGCLTQGCLLVGDPGSVEHLFHVEHRLFRRFQDGVEAADDDHGENNVSILATDIHIAQDIVCNAPDEIGNPVQSAVLHVCFLIPEFLENLILRVEILDVYAR
jgi:hypothetical protein